MDKKLTAKQFREISMPMIDDITAAFTVTRDRMLKELTKKDVTPEAMIKKLDKMI